MHNSQTQLQNVTIIESINNHSLNLISFQRFLKIVHVILVPVRIHELLVLPEALGFGDLRRVVGFGDVACYAVACVVSFANESVGEDRSTDCDGCEEGNGPRVATLLRERCDKGGESGGERAYQRPRRTGRRGAAPLKGVRCGEGADSSGCIDSIVIVSLEFRVNFVRISKRRSDRGMRRI
jgi:hypothetical protein